jgi:hypothetical protein
MKWHANLPPNEAVFLFYFGANGKVLKILGLKNGKVLKNLLLKIWKGAQKPRLYE